MNEGENELSLDIENNDTGLFRADFTVTIENLPLVINITCEVTELTDTRINLSFDAKSSILSNIVRGKSVEMTVMVIHICFRLSGSTDQSVYLGYLAA